MAASPSVTRRHGSVAVGHATPSQRRCRSRDAQPASPSTRSCCVPFRPRSAVHHRARRCAAARRAGRPVAPRRPCLGPGAGRCPRAGQRAGGRAGRAHRPLRVHLGAGGARARGARTSRRAGYGARGGGGEDRARARGARPCGLHPRGHTTARVAARRGGSAVRARAGRAGRPRAATRHRRARGGHGGAHRAGPGHRTGRPAACGPPAAHRAARSRPDRTRSRARRCSHPGRQPGSHRRAPAHHRPGVAARHLRLPTGPQRHPLHRLVGLPAVRRSSPPGHRHHGADGHTRLRLHRRRDRPALQQSARWHLAVPARGRRQYLLLHPPPGLRGCGRRRDPGAGR